MTIACLIANLHAALFYIFFIFFMPYIAEYLIVLIRDKHLIYKANVRMTKEKIEKLSKKENKAEQIAKLNEKLKKIEENFVKYKEKSEKRLENPYKIKLVKRDAVKWLFLIIILCFAMGLLTPIGDEPYTHIFKLMSGNTTDSISEHQPLILKGHYGAIISLVLVFGLVIFTDTKITLKDLFMLGRTNNNDVYGKKTILIACSNRSIFINKVNHRFP